MGFDRKLLVIDDDEAMCDFICEAAQYCDYQTNSVSETGRIKEALNEKPDLIVLDLVMPDMDGIEVLRLLSQQKINSGIILSSGLDQRVLKSAALLANELGLTIIGSLLKPFRFEDVTGLLAKEKTLVEHSNKKRFKVTFEKVQQAIDKEQFHAYFQPKINLSTNQVAGFEALVRWVHPDEGMISPVDFIPFTEQSGQIEDITRIVIEQGLAMLTSLKTKGLKLRLAINVPAKLLMDISFTDRLINKLQSSEITPQDIIVEVTESDVINEISSGLDVVTRLRMKGVHLSIDDFGTGHSSMERLANIPFTELKLDKSFVSNLQDDSSRKIVINSIKLGHDLGMTVIAEGIEDKDTCQQLAKLGCDEAQGYFIARPMPVTEVPDWLDNYHKSEPARCFELKEVK